MQRPDFADHKTACIEQEVNIPSWKTFPPERVLQPTGSAAGKREAQKTF